MIAIKGMEMPSSCQDCSFTKNKRTNDYGSFCECGILEDYETINLLEHSKSPNCPLVNQEPCEDAVSRQAVLDIVDSYSESRSNVEDVTQDIISDILALPPVTPKQRTGWIPFTYRPATDEEKKDFAKRTGYDEEDIDTILNCQLPEDGETVLITDRLGNVEVDTFINDGDGCYFECNCDMEDVIAWMTLPKPYEPQTESEE